MRTLGIVTANRSSSSWERCSIAVSSICHVALAGPLEQLLAAEEEVGDDVEVVREREILVHGGDAELRRVLGGANGDRDPVHRDLTVVGRVDAGDDLHQRRLAGSVVADEPDDLAGVDLEVHAVERLDGAEALADVLEGEQGRGHG